MSAATHLDSPRREPVRTVKVVVTGPYAAGTSTFVRTISEVAVLSTEEPGGATAAATAAPAVAMDFGRVSLGADLALYLFGTSGSDRFDVSWELIADGMLGVVIVVDGTVDDDAASRALGRAVVEVAAVPVVVAINTRVAADPDVLIGRVRERACLPEHVPVVVADVRDREDVKRVLLRLLEAARHHLDVGAPAPVAEVAR